MAERDTTVAVLADDLIWATRLVDAVRATGAAPIRLRRASDFPGAAGQATGYAIVDLTARAYDGVEAIRVARGLGLRVVAVGQHDDVELRHRAMEAGAERVFTYRQLFEQGRERLATWLATPAAGAGG